MPKPYVQYAPEIGEEICRRMAAGETIFRICEDPAMPSRAAVYMWIADNEREELADFQKMYAAATKAQALAMADECISIADETSNDTLLKETQGGEGYEVANHEWISRSRLRVETRMKLIAKKAPSLFGDSMALTGAGGGPIMTKEISGRDLGRRLAFVLASGLIEAPKDDSGDGES